MKLLRNKKIVTLAALAALTAIASAATGWIHGVLSPNDSDTWYGTYTRGWLSVDINGSGYGDLDVYIYGEDGTLLGQDNAPDNHPMVEFFIPYTQEIDVVVVNHGDYTASYTGTVE